VLAKPVVLYLKAQIPKAVLYAPVVLEAKALLPTLVLVIILPPPLPTLTLPFTSKSPLDC
jgi:hypothetical protein